MPPGPQPQFPRGSQAPPGSGAPPQSYNYGQRNGMRPFTNENQMPNVQTPYGTFRFNPAAANDFKGLMRDLYQHGFPMRTAGTWNFRPMRRGGGWSSHAFGNAFDIDDEASLSPQTRNWILNNENLWKSLLAKWNFGQPLGGDDGVSGPDAPHVEWRGPGTPGQPQVAQNPQQPYWPHARVTQSQPQTPPVGGPWKPTEATNPTDPSMVRKAPGDMDPGIEVQPAQPWSVDSYPWTTLPQDQSGTIGT
jgi:hypothetical protein